VLFRSGRYSKFRDLIFQNLRKKGIGVQLHYIPVYKHPYYANLGYKSGLCPTSETLSNKIISLPIFPNLTLDEQDYVISSLKNELISLDENCNFSR